VILAVLASGIPPTLSYEIGFYDVLTLLGAGAIAVSRRPWLVAVGAVVLSGSNPPLALVSAISFAILSAGEPFRGLRQKALITLTICLLGWLAVNLWLHAAGTSSESSQLFTNLGYSFRSFLDAAPLDVSSWYGGAWLLVVITIVSPMAWRTRCIVVGALIVVPGLGSVATLDGTRVFVCAAALPALAALWTYAEATTAGLRSASAVDGLRAEITTWVGLLALTAPFVPALYYRGDIREVWLPWSWFLNGHHFT
jgi:hypothetical protein